MLNNITCVVGAGYRSTVCRLASMLRTLGESVAMIDLAPGTEKINDYFRFYNADEDDGDMVSINGMGYTIGAGYVGAGGYTESLGTDYSAQIVLLGNEPEDCDFALIEHHERVLVIVEEDPAQIRRLIRAYKNREETKKNDGYSDELETKVDTRLIVLNYTGKGRHAVHELKKVIRPSKTLIMKQDKRSIAREKKFDFAERTCMTELPEDYLQFLADTLAVIYKDGVECGFEDEEEKLKKLDASNLHKLARAAERRKELK